MSDFTITHSPATQMAHTASSEVVGAVFHNDYDGPPFYRACTASELDQHLEAGCEVIFGSDPDEIEMQLQAKYPVDSPLLRRVLRKDGYVPDEEFNEWVSLDRRKHRRRRSSTHWYVDRSERKAACWLVLPYPYADLEQLKASNNDLLTPDDVRQLIEIYGRILVNEGSRPLSNWHRDGFTAVTRQPDLLLLNFNPKHFSVQKLKQEKQAYAEQMRGYFPCSSLRDLYKILQSLEGVKSPYKNVLALTHLDIAYRDIADKKTELDAPGTCLTRCVEIVTKIRLALELVRRVAPGSGTWWRDAISHNHRGYYKHLRVSDVLHELLPWLHGVEAVCNYSDEQLEAITNFYEADNIHHLHWFCRWLRKEAKAAELKIPPKPALPKPPSSKKPKRRGSKGSAAKASRSRKKSAAPAPPAARTPAAESGS